MNKDTSKGIKDNLHKDIVGFSEELQSKFPDIVFTSGLRPGAKTKMGKESRHSHGEAIDFRINPKIGNYLESDDGIELLHKYQLGFLDESKAGNKKWGNAMHAGRDSALVENTNKKYKNITSKQEPVVDKTTSTINYLDSNQQNTTFTNNIDEEKQIDKEVEEVEQKTKEYNFLDELQKIQQSDYSYLQPEEKPQQNIPQVDYIKQYEDISSFVDNPTAQQGGKVGIQGGKYTNNEISFLSEIAIKDNNGYWSKDNRGKVVEIDGNKMATNGYGDIPLYVIPDKGKPKLVLPNTGTHTFKGASKFIEIPVKK